MPTETADYIADLNPSIPRGTNSRSEGDDHLRLLKKVLKNTFPSFTSAEGYVVIGQLALINEAFESFRFFPSKTIIPYNGVVIPPGWKPCTGENGTPNLRDRFIVGASADKLPGATGGSPDFSFSNLDTEGHAVTLQELPKHKHEVKGMAHKDSIGAGSPIQNVGAEIGKGGNAPYGLNVVTSEVGGDGGVDAEHSHKWSFLLALGNQPEFTAINFIMKL